MRRLLLDIDGVVVNVCEGLRKYFEKQGLTFNPDKMTQYNFNCDCGVDRFEIYKVLVMDELFELSEFYPNVHEGLALLRSICEVMPWTLVSTKSQKYLREKQLEVLDFDEAHSYVKVKAEVSNDYTSKHKEVFECDAIIEDNPSITEVIDKLDKKPIVYLIDRPYNREVSADYIIRVKDLLEVFAYENKYVGS